MTKKIQIDEKWYVLATFARPEEQPQVLKEGDTFAMFDRFGDIAVLAPGQEGVYHDDTRFLSHQELTVNGARPLYLGSSVEEANSLLVIDLMNPDLTVDGHVVLTKGTLHIYRAKLLWKGACYEHLRLSHHGDESATVRLEVSFEGDFVDLFEVRGMRREHRGELLAPEVGQAEVLLPYKGRDGRLRRTRVHFEPAPRGLDAGRATFDLRLDPGQEHHLYMTVMCEAEGAPLHQAMPFHSALHENNAARTLHQGGRSTLQTSNPLVNLWLDRSVSDLEMLTTYLPTGPYPYAGVPWYSTTFGRDGILTALEYLWVDPSMARGVLAFLAATQAQESDPERDAEPGKILHEARKSEMAHTREIPFGRYYGTVDATPLFLVLAGAYFRRTGDAAFMRSIWPNILAALQWIDRNAAADSDGFVTYARRSAEGLTQQGWKDSHDSVFHKSGDLAEAPIALCEVQGYVYQGRLALAGLAQALGHAQLAETQAQQAARLRLRFQSAFWCDDLGSYAIALDGHKKPCRVLSSNAGHVLWSGIAAPDHARRIIDGLMGPEFFSGWGIRTIAAAQPRYNPMSYHNGSIWPHDNAIIAAGMARYGRTEEAVRLLASLFDASLHFERHRLPELFCGFPRRPGAGPTLYPVACSPQAWASAAPFGILQACLGLEIAADGAEISLHTPQLPPFIDWLRISRLGSPGPSCDVLLQRYQRNVGVEVLRKDADVRVSVVA
jgi:glycogen debranching enzyme